MDFFRFRAEKPGLKRNVTGLGENEFFQLQIHPREGKGVECSLGEIGGERFDQFAFFLTGCFLQELAEVVVVDRVGKVVGLGGFFQIGNGKNGGAEDLLRLGTFFYRYAQMTGELEINQRKNGCHDDLGRRMRVKASTMSSSRAKAPT